MTFRCPMHGEHSEERCPSCAELGWFIGSVTVAQCDEPDCECSYSGDREDALAWAEEHRKTTGHSV